MGRTQTETTLACPQAVVDLVARFAEHREAYQRQTYNETQVRREFIDPFFSALGWDVDNRSGAAEAYKDVIHEDAIKVGGASKAPDYCFRIGGTRKFFVEAKKPAVGVGDDPGPAYQVRRYAWSNKLPLSIVTDFEEFAVYDCRIPPKAKDKASVARVMYLTCDEYAAKWGEIASIFSKDAILKGSFDKYAESNRRKKGTAEVDEEILKEIEAWREALAKNFALRNEKLSVRDLNFAVERTIDRIIFLRMCEDRSIETYGRLQGLLNGSAIYGRLAQLFREADDKYNAGLFYFRQEAERGPPDELTLGLTLDDKVLKEIIVRLYYPESPYEFSVLPPEILGQVYEQFLGKVIRLTAGHRAVVEEKPEVRKAGGVYYTPTYIVDYIVKNTVGKLLEGKTPADVGPERETKTGKRRKVAKGAKMLRVLDPACGSGSFLLGAYQNLLDWHRDWYVTDGPPKHKERVYQGAGGQWRLSIREKKRILLNNIYGVDIDAQAVEVTKLSLLLKVLEGETAESIGSTLRLFHERALPDLAENIKCGNSLIGPDFYEGKQLSMFDEEERYRINAFDWKTEFAEAFEAGGFDAVIGNPPYILLQDEFRDDDQLAYFRQRYQAASFKLDTYHLFVEKATTLARREGRCSMITPANFLTNNHLVELRRLMLTKNRIDHLLIVDGGVFDGISVDNAVFVLVAGQKESVSFPIFHAVPSDTSLSLTTQMTVVVKDAMANPHVLFTGTGSISRTALWREVMSRSKTLGTIATVNFGKQLRDRKKFPEDVITVGGAGRVPAKYVACYTGRDVNRWVLGWSKLACLNDEIAQSGGCWDEAKHNPKDKLVTRQIGRYPDFAIDESGFHCLNTMFMVNVSNRQCSPRYLLGILNSTLLRAFWLDHFYDQRRTFPKIKGTYLKELPILLVDVSNRSKKVMHDRLVDLVDQMISVHKTLATAKTEHEKTSFQRQIDATDAQIDRLVYELYGLTEEEIRIVEEGTK